MVSGFFTSPCDHDRILSGEASEMRIALNARGFLGFSNRLKRSSIIAVLPPWKVQSWLDAVLDQLDVECEALQLLHHDVERLGQPGLEHVLSLDDGLVHAGAAGHVVRLDREHLLQRVGLSLIHISEPKRLLSISSA